MVGIFHQSAYELLDDLEARRFPKNRESSRKASTQHATVQSMRWYEVLVETIGARLGEPRRREDRMSAIRTVTLDNGRHP